MARSEYVFDKVRVRYLVSIWLLTIIYLPGAGYVAQIAGLATNWYSLNLTYVYYAQLLFLVVVLLTSTIPSKLPIRRIFGREPTKSEYSSGLVLSAFLFALAWAAAYVLFLPLSYWIPDFVEYWYIDVPEIVYYDRGVYPFVANLLSIISLCIVAPIIEEFAFRGLILHRWSYRYGIMPAILGSSIVFGIVHPDPLGAFFFGVAMCILYLRTQSLWLPIVCHGIYNLVVWLIELGYVIHYGPEFDYTLEQFQNDWPYGLMALVIVTAWATMYLKRSKIEHNWKLPVT